MHDHGLLIDVLIFLVAAVIVVPTFRRLKYASVLGYLAAGMAIGPYGLGLVGDTDGARALAEFGVVFLLFMIGLELSFDRIRLLGRLVFGLGTVQVLVTMAVVFAAFAAWGYDWRTALVIGGGLALSSTAFVLQMLQERNERASRHGNTVFSILLLQDLAVVPLLILVAALSGGADAGLEGAFMAIAQAVTAVGIILIAGRYLLRPVYRLIAGTQSTELFTAASLLAVLGAAFLVSQAGLSMLIGAFLAGMLIAETEYRHQIEADIRPFRGLLLGLFFMTIGMTIDTRFVFDNALIIAVAVLCVLFSKAIIAAASCRLFGLPAPVAVRAGFLLSQGGEFGFVLFAAASAAGLLLVADEQLLAALISVSMAATPAMDWLGRQLSQVLQGRSQELGPFQGGDAEEWSDHVVIAGFGRVGQTVAKVLSACGIPYVALEHDAVRVTRCRALGLPVYFGDASRVDILRAVGLEQAKAVVVTLNQFGRTRDIVQAMQTMAPCLPIIARARDVRHAVELEAVGADEVIPDALEVSLQLGLSATETFDISSDTATSVVQAWREANYAELLDVVPGSVDEPDG